MSLKTIVNVLVENRETIAGLIILLVFCVYEVRNFLLLNDTAKRKQVLHWLEYKVSDAEAEFGSKTGQLKLRKVYTEFIKQYPVCARFVTFERFNDLVKEALVWMEDQIKKNAQIQAAING